jgi:hypothetical protein
MLLLAAIVASAPHATVHDADTPEQAIRSWFGAMARNDAAANARLLSSTFYAFDNGKRFRGGELFDLIRQLHGSGVVIQWNLGPIDVHRRGATAWAAWENEGAVGHAGEMQPVTWLESANLHRTRGRWMIDFLNSARVPPPTPVR